MTEIVVENASCKADGELVNPNGVHSSYIYEVLLFGVWIYESCCNKYVSLKNKNFESSFQKVSVSEKWSYVVIFCYNLKKSKRNDWKMCFTTFKSFKK